MWLFEKIDVLIDKVKKYFATEDYVVTDNVVIKKEDYLSGIELEAFELIKDLISIDDFNRILRRLSVCSNPDIKYTPESFARHVLEGQNKWLLREKSKVLERARDIDLINELKVKIKNGGES